jgi:ABC-type proline/glycine betaine transport system permease subunit
VEFVYPGASLPELVWEHLQLVLISGGLAVTVGLLLGLYVTRPAGGLGSPIIAGLVRQNLAYVLEGAITAALLAIVVDLVLAWLEANPSWKAERVEVK